MLGRTDLEIAVITMRLPADPLRTCAQPIAKEYALTVRHVLHLRGSPDCSTSDPTLQRSIKLRNPYVDPIASHAGGFTAPLACHAAAGIKTCSGALRPHQRHRARSAGDG